MGARAGAMRSRLLRRPMRRLRDSDSGQSLVEFGMVLPFFLILLFALVDFGRAFYTWQIITNSAREGARVGAVAPTNTSSITAGARDAAGALDDANLAVSIATPSGVAKGNPINVTASYNFQLVTPLNPLLNLIGGASLANPTITSTASMRIE